jgi:hypothetical protein|nr:MAG TPA: hypothetical protein [Siphoviridae sp. ctIwT7]
MFEESKHPRDNEGKFTDKLKSAVKIYSDVPDKDMAGMGLERGKDTYSLPDEVLPKSLSAKWINYEIELPNGKKARFAEGSKLQDKEVFAGKGCKRKIDEEERLVEQYHQPMGSWMKVKARAVLVDESGEERSAEVHWYETKAGGKEEIKFKKWLK